MNKFLKKAFAVISAGGIAAAMILPTASVMAANYTPIAGTTTTFNKYLIMDEGDTVPNATFSFTVAPGAHIAAGSGTMEVLAGIGTPTIADVTFGPSDTTATSTTGLIDVTRTQQDRIGTAGTDTVQLDIGEKFTTKEATVDFSGITFPEPGIYRYIITETASAANAAAGIIHDTDVDRVLDVYVVHSEGSAGTAAVPATTWYYGGNTYNTQADAQDAYNADGGAQGEITDNGVAAVPAEPAGLVVSQYVLHCDVGTVAANATNGSADVATAGTALADKTDGFTNELTSKDLKIEKSVAGNQASHDKYFALTVTMATGTVNTADSFVVSLADDNNAATNDGNADATSGSNAATIAANSGQTNATTVTGAELLAGKVFYLQHGQSVVIRGLPVTANYTVTENAEDYQSAADGRTNTGVIGTVASGKMVTAGFTNTRNGIIPTGVMLASGIGIAALVIGAGGIVIVNKKRRANEDIEEDAESVTQG